MQAVSNNNNININTKVISNSAPKIPMKKSPSHSSILNVKKSLFSYSFSQDRNNKLLSINGSDSGNVSSVNTPPLSPCDSSVGSVHNSPRLPPVSLPLNYDIEVQNIKKQPIVPPRPKFNAHPAIKIAKEQFAKAEAKGIELDESFFVADLGSIESQINYWNRQMAGITPYYAVKCNQDRKVLALMASMGIGFDCASRNEIQMVISLGVHPERIIYANPCKPISHLKYAHSVGVRKFTFDNYEELLKVKKYLPNGQAVIRVLTDDSKSLCPFGTKFGVHPKLAPKLLDQAKELGIDMMGVSFHVGSGCKDVRSYDDAILRARRIFDYASSIGYNMSFLDIGGGFPGHPQEGTSLPEISQVVFDAINTYFPKGVQIIAEPGRFLVSQSYTLFSNVTSKRKVESIDGTRPASDVDFMYYLTDGVYGCFNNTVFDHYTPRPIAFRQNDEYISDPSQLVASPCSIWGPTCDSVDVITKKALLPELFIGDWIMFHHMGAYTVAAASTFQSQPVSRIVYTNSLSGQIPKVENIENWPSVQSFERELMN